MSDEQAKIIDEQAARIDYLLEVIEHREKQIFRAMDKADMWRQHAFHTWCMLILTAVLAFGIMFRYGPL